MTVMARQSWLLDLRGGPTPYAGAWELQKALVAARQREEVTDGLMLLEHEPVFTIGRSGQSDHLLYPRELLAGKGFGVYEIERGGSVTYHGPGQLVGYPILDLRSYHEDVVKYMRSLEETIIRTLLDFGIAAQLQRVIAPYQPASSTGESGEASAPDGAGLASEHPLAVSG